MRTAEAGTGEGIRGTRPAAGLPLVTHHPVVPVGSPRRSFPGSRTPFPTFHRVRAVVLAISRPKERGLSDMFCALFFGDPSPPVLSLSRSVPSTMTMVPLREEPPARVRRSSISDDTPTRGRRPGSPISPPTAADLVPVRDSSDGQARSSALRLRLPSGSVVARVRCACQALVFA